ncbi:MAG TPA: bifunctional precorrin-2 dehydrogenase/sirohydrochlorin ferrochelatase [Gemmatimonadaceae bacterium]|nr:bifunctional precorrin-2 dehydrogenase/sirohydrochlorin ferrochelatase [Gemmatimonadaceae bacterium]
MSAFPIALNGQRVRALVVGAGAVGTRKALALLDAGANVRVVAPEVSAGVVRAESEHRLTVLRVAYAPDVLGDATLVIAATSSRDVNSVVAADARERGILVNVADAPEEGDFHSMAVHRRGDLTIAVSTAGVPAAAARIRDSLARRFDERYEHALAALHRMRSRLRAADGGAWQRAADDLIGEDFCDSVEAGAVPERVASWR